MSVRTKTCPCCGIESTRTYRCEDCGRDLVDEDATTEGFQ